MYGFNNSADIFVLFSGVEPWMFYFHNGFLNFNVAFMMALVALPVAVSSSQLSLPSVAVSTLDLKWKSNFIPANSRSRSVLEI